MEVFVVPLRKLREPSEVGVRQLNVADLTCWFDLSLLCGLLGAAFLRALLCATLFRCGLLSTFFSCHSFYVLLFSKFGFRS